MRDEQEVLDELMARMKALIRSLMREGSLCVLEERVAISDAIEPALFEPLHTFCQAYDRIASVSAPGAVWNEKKVRTPGVAYVSAPGAVCNEDNVRTPGVAYEDPGSGINKKAPGARNKKMGMSKKRVR